MSSLPFGTTPFDSMSAEELRMQCARLYAATVSLTSLVQVLKLGNEGSPYWTSGSAGCALEEGLQALEAARCGHDAGEMYDAYFRYATSLLFKNKPGLELVSEWVICPKCEQMQSKRLTKGEAPLVGQVHKEETGWGDCDGVLRPLQWDDLKPRAGNSE